MFLRGSWDVKRKDTALLCFVLLWFKTVGIVAWLMKSLYLHFNGKLKCWRRVIFFYMFACVFHNRLEVEYKILHNIGVFFFIMLLSREVSVSEGLESQT